MPSHDADDLDLYDTTDPFDDEAIEPVVTDNQQKSPKKKPLKPAEKTFDFQQWVARKDKYERVLQALHTLSTDRASRESSWFDVAVALAATDCLLKVGRTEACNCDGVCHDPNHAVSRQRIRCQCPAPKCSICNRCIGTTVGSITDKMSDVLTPYRNNDTIMEVAQTILTMGEGRLLNGVKISGLALRMATTVVAQCSVLLGNDGAKLQRPCTCPLRSLGDHWVRWTKANHSFEKVRLSEAQAKKFGGATRQLMEFIEADNVYLLTIKWRVAAKAQKGDTAKIAARRCLSADEKKLNAIFVSLCKKHWVKAQHRVVEMLQEKMAAAVKKQEESAKTPGQVVKTQAELETQILKLIGVQKMLAWVEADNEAIKEKEEEVQKEKAEEGAHAHSAWLKRKDRLRLRLPTSSNGENQIKSTWKPPRFDFSTQGLVRPKKIDIPSCTVDMMKRSGLKYVHAMSEGFQGRGGDLDKCREHLLKQGHIIKANFAKDPDSTFSEDRYHFEKQNAPKAKGNPRQGMSKEAFAAWSAHKALKDKALQYLAAITKPSEMKDDPTARWEEVGRALKAVDRGLLLHWMQWSSEFMSQGRCRILWESFAPIACDVHSTSSAIRDIFLKLLHRKDVNYKAAFLAFAEKKHRKAVAEGTAEEDMKDDEKLELFSSMNQKDFTKFLSTLGITLHAEERDRVIEFFDANGDGTITIKEFLAVTGDARPVQCHGDTEVALKDVCMWETVCHECGMINAFQVVLNSKSNVRMRAELPAHVKRRGLSRFNCKPIFNMREVKEAAPYACDYASWNDQKAASGVATLDRLSIENRERSALQKLVTEGAPPEMPILFRDDDETLDPTTMLLLRWNPPPVRGNNGPAFYVLETSGAEGSTTYKQNVFRELVRDPKDFNDNQGEPRYHYVMTGLIPNTKYALRLRALNAFGAGPYAFGYFTTVPRIPPAPMAVKITPTTIHLSWNSSAWYETQLKELRQVFDEADVDHNGEISRDEFMEELEKRKPRLLDFLQTTAAGTAETTGVPLSVFDMIETNDSNTISWSEFVQMFNSHLDDIHAFDEDTKSVKSSASRVSKSGKAKASSCRYILKQCVHEADGHYEEIYRGSKANFLVHGLTSGMAYQFRVQAINAEDQASLHSAPTIVNTLLPTPLAPTASDIRETQVLISWVPGDATAGDKKSIAQKSKSNALDDSIQRMLKEWAKETTVDHPSIDFVGKFQRYDRDGSGYIELPEFKTLLSELGVSPTEERLAAYMESFDTNNDGKISFEEFKDWWTKPDVQYVLKRSDGSSSDMNTVVFRGSTPCSCVVRGLAPNTQYHFRLRHVSSHASSSLSPALTLVTLPQAPTAVGVIEVLATKARLVWYPSSSGASRYLVEAKFIECLGDTKPKCRLDWTTVYEGSDTMATITELLANSVYRLRVRAGNSSRNWSEYGRVTQLCTLVKDPSLKPSNAVERFTVEVAASGQLVPGDTILFTERLLLIDNAAVEEERKRGKSMKAPSSKAEVECIGERTLAARVNSITIDMAQKCGVAMDVVWCTVQIYETTKSLVSKQVAMNATLPTDAKISRYEKSILKYEAFRLPWQDEAARTKGTWIE